MSAEAESISSDKLLLALVRLAVDDRSQRLGTTAEPAKTELLSAEVGLSAKEIGALTGQKPNTVSQILSRARR